MRNTIMLLIVVAGLALAGSAATGHPVRYPVRHTVAAPIVIAPENRFPLFLEVGKMVKITTGKVAAITAVYLLRNANGTDMTICGEALVGPERAASTFVVTKQKTYMDVDDQGWASLGCSTPGGLLLQWKPRLDGAEGMEIR